MRQWFSDFRRKLLSVAWSRSGAKRSLNIDVLALDVKALGYHVARQLGASLETTDCSGEPVARHLPCKPSTQLDFQTPWFRHWCRELAIAPIFHRKLWEYAFVLQALFDEGKLRAGNAGLGFGCGEEPVASYLAALEVDATVTDLDPAAAKGRGWMETGQHASALDQAYKAELVTRDTFDRLVRLEYVDMNAIPPHLGGRFDFCWSICAMEHLGTIERGLRFVENAMDTLKPGGVAIHTTEYNYLSEHDTIDRNPTVLFLRKHFIELKRRLEASGHTVRELDFDTGSGVLDRFIDVPPYGWEGLPERTWGRWGVDIGHLKLTIGPYPSTCFGLVVRKRS